MNKSRIIIIILICFLGLIGVISLIRKIGLYYSGEGRGSVTDTITIYDTIPYENPVPKDSVVIRYVTQRLPVVDDKEDNFPNKGNNDEQNIPQPGNNASENIPDSADVVIPITQKIYEDSSYKAYVSGYKASLDSFYIYPQTKVITIREQPKRWHIGITAGYGVTAKGLEPYIGIGISYSIIAF